MLHCQFTSKMKFQSIVNLLNESEHIYVTLDLRDEIHSTWGLWRSGLEECNGNGFLEVGWDGQRFSGGSRKSRLLCGVAAHDILFLPRMARRG